MGQHRRLPHILIPQAVLPPSHLKSTVDLSINPRTDLIADLSLSPPHSHADARVSSEGVMPGMVSGG